MPAPHHPRGAQRRPLRTTADRALLPVVRHALLGDAPLPTRRWEDVSRGRIGAVTRLIECALDARRHARRTAADIRAGLRRIADAQAELVEALLAADALPCTA